MNAGVNPPACENANGKLSNPAPRAALTVKKIAAGTDVATELACDTSDNRSLVSGSYRWRLIEELS